MVCNGNFHLCWWWVFLIKARILNSRLLSLAGMKPPSDWVVSLWVSPNITTSCKYTLESPYSRTQSHSVVFFFQNSCTTQLILLLHVTRNNTQYILNIYSFFFGELQHEESHRKTIESGVFIVITNLQS